jgi:hypothetical protein
MKWLKLILGAGASLLAMTVYAHADPVSIGFALWATIGAALPSISFATFVTIGSILPTALAVGASLATSLLAGRPRIDPGKYKDTFKESSGSEINAIGRCELGGLRAFGNTKGADRYRLVCHAKGPLVAIEEYKLGGRAVTVDSDGSVSSPPYAKSSGSFVTWLTKVGDGTETAWTSLTSAFPTIWDSDHRVRGIGQSLIKYVSPGFTNSRFVKMYQGGEPAGSIIGRWNICFDPRDAAQDKDDETTWKWSTNGILGAVRIMLTYPDLTVDSFDWDLIADEADKADVLVSTKTGMEKRSQISGVWESQSKRGDTMQQVLDSVGAEVVDSDAGLIGIRLIDDAPTAEIEFQAKYQTEFNWKSGPDAVERPNICTLKYYSPELNYTHGEIDLTGIAWARIDDEVTRYGEKEFAVELPFCPSASQAQRIARRLFALTRADSGTIKTNMVGLAAWGRTYADIEDSTAEEMMLTKIAPPRIDDEAGEVEIPFAVWPTLAAWNPETDEADAPEQLPDIQYETDMATPNAPSGAMAVQYAGGAYEMRVPISGAGDGSGLEVNFRGYTGSLPDSWQAMNEVGRTLAYVSGDYRGHKLDFRARVFNGDGETSYFSDVAAVASLAIDNTAPTAPVIGAVTPVVDQFGSTIAYTASVSGSSITAVKIVMGTTAGGGGTVDHRPGQSYGLTTTSAPTTPITFFAAAYASNGAASSTTTKTYNPLG